MALNLLFGYHAIGSSHLWDFGNDPYFYSKPFSWGICRPNSRSKVGINSKIFFYTFKCSTGDYYLTGMMKVENILTQIEAANDSILYCGRERDTCPYKIKPIHSLTSSDLKDGEKTELLNALAIKKRDCRCNIIVNKSGEYKEFCDGGNHLHIYLKYLKKKIYFVSTVNESISTKDRIRLLDYISPDTKFWNFGRRYGYALSENLTKKFENILRAKEYKETT